MNDDDDRSCIVFFASLPFSHVDKYIELSPEEKFNADFVIRSDLLLGCTDERISYGFISVVKKSENNNKEEEEFASILHHRMQQTVQVATLLFRLDAG